MPLLVIVFSLLVLCTLCSALFLWIAAEFLAFRRERRRALFHVFRCDSCCLWQSGQRDEIPCQRCGRSLEPLNF
ncbi:MAG: hypothetical protein LBH53_00500 [Puniceicoccales bacterium]|nr:hypothetical protein [Puniceicoccales bacterium]